MISPEATRRSVSQSATNRVPPKRDSSRAILDLAFSAPVLAGSVRVEPSSHAPGKDRGVALETPDGAVDAEEQLPGGLRDRRQALERAQRAARIVTGEQHGRPGDDDQRPADEPEPRPRSRHELRAVHHVTEDQPVSPADDPARPQQERPVLDRRKGVGDRRLGGTCNLLLQGGDVRASRRCRRG